MSAVKLSQLQLAPMVVTVALLPLVYWVTWMVLTGDFTSDLKAMVVGQVMGVALGSSVQYWLGSSNGSARKDERNRQEQQVAADETQKGP